MLLRGILCGLCLLPPTLLMGASLPAIARWIEADASRRFAARPALWREYRRCGPGMPRRRLLPAARFRHAHRDVRGRRNQRPDCAREFHSLFAQLSGCVLSDLAANAVSWPIYVTIALSGLTALGAEVVWTRLLSFLLGATVYTFAIILAVFLIGIGLGSAAGSLLARTARNSTRLAVRQPIVLAASIAWSAWMIYRSLPYWPINFQLSATHGSTSNSTSSAAFGRSCRPR